MSRPLDQNTPSRGYNEKKGVSTENHEYPYLELSSISEEEQIKIAEAISLQEYKDLELVRAVDRALTFNNYRANTSTPPILESSNPGRSIRTYPRPAGGRLSSEPTNLETKYEENPTIGTPITPTDTLYPYPPRHSADQSNLPATLTETSSTFPTRLQQSKVCVIGAGYGVRDAKRWEVVDPNYIGINGHPELMGNIEGNPIGTFDWNTDLCWASRVFGSDLTVAGQWHDFETLYIDRGTLRAHMLPATVNHLFRLLALWSSRRKMSIGKVMIPKMDVTFLTQIPENGPKQKDSWDRVIAKHANYAASIDAWLTCVSKDTVVIADVEFKQYQFKPIPPSRVR
jgi:hypothetical protein